MDPGYSAAKQAVALAYDILVPFAKTHTLEEIATLQAEADREREIRKRLYGTPRPAPSSPR